jgi:hypothetical protein
MATTKKTSAKKSTTPKKINGGKSNKSAKVVAMMRAAKGTTRAAILEATGWKTVSPKAVAAASGFKIRIDNSASPYRYFIVKAGG